MKHGEINKDQYAYLLSPLRGTRVASRQASGKTLSYLESWDVRAHLNRIFGFGHWDLELLDYAYLGTRAYETEPKRNASPKEREDFVPKPMCEPMWHARMRLTVRDENQQPLATYTEAAVGTASGPDYLLGELHDNALKTAASDALKRCAINLGTQFGLSLYSNGQRTDVVKGTLITPPGYEKPELTEEQQQQLEHSVGATGEETNEAAAEPQEGSAE